MKRFQIALQAGVCLGAGLVLGACSSAEEKAAKSGQKPMSDSMAARMLSVDMNKRSSFESALVTQNSGMGDRMGKRGFKSGEYQAGTKAFRTPKTLEAKTFSRAEDRSRLGDQGFQGASKKSGLGDDSFKTGAAREVGQEARQQGQTFRGADEVFATGMVRDAAKSQEKDLRPVIIKPEPGAMQEDQPYTEEQIRRMVNRR